MKTVQKMSIQGWSAVVLSLILTASLALNVLLSQRVRRLASHVESQQQAIQNLRSEMQLKPGEAVPDITGVTPQGQPLKIVYSEDPRPVVLYLMKPSCIWCRRNARNIAHLAAERIHQFRFFGLTLAEDEFAEAADPQSHPFPILAQLSPAVVNAYKLGGTPRTIVVDQDSRVLKTWTGAYSGKVEEEIEDFFQVSLPGLPQDGEQEVMSRR